eukprot:Colp12_sorted_trinity150504_noHs@5967
MMHFSHHRHKGSQAVMEQKVAELELLFRDLHSTLLKKEQEMVKQNESIRQAHEREAQLRQLVVSLERQVGELSERQRALEAQLSACNCSGLSVHRQHHKGASWDETVDNFDAMGLDVGLLAGIEYAYGYEAPTAIQQRAIMPCIKGHNVIAQAPHNSGLTTALCIAALQRVDTSKHRCQALILAPSEKAAMEIQTLILGLTCRMQVTCYAITITPLDVKAYSTGIGVCEGVAALKGDAHVIIGTPSHVQSMIHDGVFPVNSIEILVVDGADEMLQDPTYKDQVYEISQRLPSINRQTVFGFSSIFSTNEVLDATKHLVLSPVHVRLEQALTQKLEVSKHMCAFVGSSGPAKLTALCHVWNTFHPRGLAIIFCHSKETADQVASALMCADVVEVAVAVREHST